MPRHSRTHAPGLFRETVKRTNKDGTVHTEERYRIDLRWREGSTGEIKRFTQRLPEGVSLATAKARAREIANAALAGGFDPKREAPKRLGEALDEYEKWAATNRPLTADARKGLAKNLRRVLGDPRIDEISPFQVERLKRDRTAEGVAPGTVNREVAMLKHMLGLAAQWGWLPKSKADAVRGVKLMKEPPGRVRYLTGDEEARLLAALPPGVRPVVEAALLSGMRAGELCGLRKDAVDLPGRLITLTVTKANRVRRIPINAELAALLEVAMARSPGDFVFASRLKRPYTVRGVSRMFRRARVKAKIEDLRLHDTRHDFATSLRRNGVGLDAISALLGHATLTMTQRYAHIETATLRAAVDSLGHTTPVATPFPHGTPVALPKAAND